MIQDASKGFELEVSEDMLPKMMLLEEAKKKGLPVTIVEVTEPKPPGNYYVSI